MSILGPWSSILNNDIHVLMYICVVSCCQAVISCTSVEAMHFWCRKAKNSCFAPKTLIYGIFVANVAKNTTQQRFEDTILRKLANEDKPQVCRPAYHTGNMKVCKTMRARPKKLFLLRLCSFAIFPWTWTNEGVSHQDQEKEMLYSCCRSSNGCKYCDCVSAPDPKPLWTQI